MNKRCFGGHLPACFNTWVVLTSGPGTAPTKPWKALLHHVVQGRFQPSDRPTPMDARGCFISVLATGYAQ